MEGCTGDKKEKAKDMRIRKLEKAEHGRTRGLYETVFSEDERRFVDYYYEHRARDNEIYAAEETEGHTGELAAMEAGLGAPGGIHAMLHLNPVTVCWGGKTEKIFYIVAVATEKEYRRRGLMRGLLECALRDLYARKAPFVFLMPAAEAIYTSFGFRRAWEWRWEEEQMLQADAADAADGPDAGLPVFRCSEQQLQALSSRVNEALGRQFTMFTLRSPDYYRHLAVQQQASGGRLEVLFRKEGGIGKPICARCTAREEFPPMMARIIHLERFLCRIKSREEKTMYWQVTDGLLPENNGLFEVTLGPEGGRAVRLSTGESGTLDAAEAGAAADGGRERRPSSGPERHIPRPECVDIAEIPGRLGADNPFGSAMICEVV